MKIDPKQNPMEFLSDVKYELKILLENIENFLVNSEE